MTKIEQAFEKFDRENPRVWLLFCRFAQQAIDAGQRKLGAKAIWERIRWSVTIETRDSTDLKLNNNYTSGYARKWQRIYPGQAYLFETRRIKQTVNHFAQ